MPSDLTKLGLPTLDSSPVAAGVCQSRLCIVCMQPCTREEDECVCGAALHTECNFSLTQSGAQHDALCHLTKRDPNSMLGVYILGHYCHIRAMPWIRELPLPVAFQHRMALVRRLCDPLQRYTVAVLSMSKSALLYSTFASPTAAARQTALYSLTHSHVAMHISMAPTMETVEAYTVVCVCLTVCKATRRTGGLQALVETLYRDIFPDAPKELASVLERQCFAVVEEDGFLRLGAEQSSTPRWAADLIELQESAERVMGLKGVAKWDEERRKLGACVFATKFH